MLDKPLQEHILQGFFKVNENKGREMKLIYIIFLSIIIVAAKNYPLESKSSHKKVGIKERFFVMAPHSPEQCRKALEELKAKNGIPLSQFDFGCNYNDHTLYGIIAGNSEDDVRSALPQVLQTHAKIKKVDKLSAAEIVKLHPEEKTFRE
jgi:hypothetical protein